MDVMEVYNQMPIVTRAYVTVCVLTTAACALDLITPFHIYFNSALIFQRHELWRLATNFFFYGNIGLDFLFHMFFLIKYSKSLEEGSFRNRSADFLWMLLFGAAILTCLAPFANVQFLGSSLTFMMVYVWGRRHPRLPLSFLGIFTFSAAYLPWVLLAFSVMLGSSPVVDLLGMAAGHTYYYLEDVYPHTPNGRRLLKTPALIKALFPTEAIRPAAPVAVAVQPRGFVLGNGGDGGGAGGGGAPAEQPAWNGRPHAD